MRKFVLMLAGTCGLMLIAAPASAYSPTTLATAVTTSAPDGSSDNSSDPLADQLDSAVAQQTQIDAAKASLSSEVAAAEGEQDNLRELIQNNQTTIAQTMVQLATAEQQFHDATERESVDKQKEVQAQQDSVQDKRLLAMDMRMQYSNTDDFLTYVIASSSVSDLMQRAGELTHLVSSTDDLVHQVQKDLTTAKSAETAAVKDEMSAQQATAVLSSDATELQQQTDTANSLISQIGTQTDAANQEIASADNQDLALVQQIAALRISQLDQLIAEAEAEAWQAANFYIQNNLGSLPPGFGSGGSGVSTKFIWPAPGTVITQPFGPTSLTFEPSYGGYPHFHTGIDLAGAMDTPILAAGDGVVVSALPGSTGYGNYIIIAHDGGVLSLYGHLDKILVQAGDTIHQGQVIGLLGSTGNSTGPHLHFEVRVNNQPVDPTPFLPPLPPGASGPPPLGH